MSILNETLKSRYIEDIQNKVSDRWGMVSPQVGWIDSGNGIFYTALDITLRHRHGIKQREDFVYLVNRCRNEKGFLIRTPDNRYGQEQWDNYLGVLTGALILGERGLIRDILTIAAKNKFILDTDGKFAFRDILLRFAHIWLLYLASGYHPMKWLLYPVFFVLSKLFVPTLKTSGSGINLQYMFQYTLATLYSDDGFLKKWMKKLYKKTGKKLSDNFAEYFSIRHPFTELEKEAEDININNYT